eukprot:TRINITY_DN752_c0_g1_i4.p1 TRINITY_DN752_c0_g1~~TRINITY_DN752_c0_g1_i4.p1  ORF type:complete len:224 (-),score=26.76 TRINITY_DN752_c0_g1_i4:135-806(-)
MKEMCLAYAQDCAKRRGFEVKDLTNGLADGMGFLCMVARHRKSLVNFSAHSKENPKANLEAAFSLAEKSLGIPRLLDVEDFIGQVPSDLAVIAYVTEFLQSLPGDEPDVEEKPAAPAPELLSELEALRKKVAACRCDELEELRRKLAAAEAENKRLTTDLQAAHAKIKEHETTIEDLRKQMRKMESATKRKSTGCSCGSTGGRRRSRRGPTRSAKPRAATRTN